MDHERDGEKLLGRAAAEPAAELQRRSAKTEPARTTTALVEEYVEIREACGFQREDQRRECVLRGLDTALARFGLAVTRRSARPSHEALVSPRVNERRDEDGQSGEEARGNRRIISERECECTSSLVLLPLDPRAVPSREQRDARRIICAHYRAEMYEKRPRQADRGTDLAGILHVTSFRSRLVLLPSGSSPSQVLALLLVDEMTSRRAVAAAILVPSAIKTAIANLAWRRYVDARRWRVVGTASRRRMIDDVESRKLSTTVVILVGTRGTRSVLPSVLAVASRRSASVTIVFFALKV